jgi:exodeoxyribonuclease VIII
MLDLETFGQKPGCVIAALGAVKFGGGEIIDRFYSRIDPLTCEQAGLHVEMDAVLFWFKQPDAARLEITNPAEPLETVLQFFTAWCATTRDGQPAEVEIWSNGASFDGVVLEAAYDAVRKPLPWSFWNERCYRTAKAWFRDVPMPPREGPEHHALYDAIAQARHLMAIEAAHPPTLKPESLPATA